MDSGKDDDRRERRRRPTHAVAGYHHPPKAAAVASDDVFPPDYQPNPHDVLLGRGHEFFNFAGNRAFRELVHQHVEGYTNASTKTLKSFIVSQVVDTIHASGGNFIRWDDGRSVFYKVSSSVRREKVSSTFRELLGYASSAAVKNARRSEKNRMERRLKRPTLGHMQPKWKHISLDTTQTRASLKATGEAQEKAHQTDMLLSKALLPKNRSAVHSTSNSSKANTAPVEAPERGDDRGAYSDGSLADHSPAPPQRRRTFPLDQRRMVYDIQLEKGGTSGFPDDTETAHGCEAMAEWAGEGAALLTGASELETAAESLTLLGQEQFKPSGVQPSETLQPALAVQTQQKQVANPSSSSEEPQAPAPEGAQVLGNFRFYAV